MTPVEDRTCSVGYVSDEQNQVLFIACDRCCKWSLSHCADVVQGVLQFIVLLLKAADVGLENGNDVVHLTPPNRTIVG